MESKPVVITQRERTSEEIAADIANADHIVNTLARNGPAPADFIRGKCPSCGGDLVSQMYHVKGKGYLLAWECWQECGYRREL